MTKRKVITGQDAFARVHVDVVRYHLWRNEYNRTAKLRIACDLFESDRVTDTGKRHTDKQGRTWALLSWGIHTPIERWIPVEFIVSEREKQATSALTERILNAGGGKELRPLVVENDEDAATATALVEMMGVFVKGVVVQPPVILEAEIA